MGNCANEPDGLKNKRLCRVGSMSARPRWQVGSKAQGRGRKDVCRQVLVVLRLLKNMQVRLAPARLMRQGGPHSSTAGGGCTLQAGHVIRIRSP